MKKLVFILTVSALVCVAAPPRAEGGGAAQTRQAEAAESTPPGWREAKSQALDLVLKGKEQEVIALYEKWVARYPKFAEAEFMLGAAHESAARATFGSRAPDARALREKYYEAAILHMRRGLELAGPRAPFDWMRGFIDIHGVVGVNRPAEYERLVREAAARYPADPYAQAYLLALLAQQGQPIDAAAAAARAAIPRTADARVALAGSLAEFVADFARGIPAPASASPVLLAEASSLVDEALKLKPGDDSALRTRARIEQLRNR